MTDFKFVSKQQLSTGIIFAVVGLIFCAVCIGIYVENSRFMKTAQEVSAEVTEVHKDRVRRNGKYRTDYDVYIRYEVDGNIYNEELSGGNGSMREGQIIKVYYDPYNPRDVRTGKSGGAILFGAVFALVFVVVGVFVGVVPYVKAKKLRELKMTGQQITAMITDIIIDKSVRINKRYPFKAICEAVDPMTNEKYLYSSEGVMNDIHYLQGQLVTVYYDAYDRSRYYVDLESIDESSMGSPMIHDFR